MPATKVLKLQKNGNAVTVTVPREYLARLNWASGQGVAVQLMSDDTLWIRRPNERDYQAGVPLPVAGLANSAGPR